MKRMILLLIIALALSLGFAQVASYTFSQSTGTYSEISGGTVLGTATVGGSAATSLDDVLYPNTPLPFLFAFNGRQYNQITVTTNGYIILGGVASLSYTPISGATVADGSIAILGRDLQGNVIDGNLGEVRYETLGTAPNRVYVIQWKNFRHYGATNDNYNMQIRLNETSNVINMVYGGMLVNHVLTTFPQVGLRGATNADYLNRVVTTNWNASTAGTVNTATVNLTSTVFPPTGLTFTFTPPAAVAAPNLATAVSPANAAANVFTTSTLNWTDGGGWTNGFKLYFGTDPTPAYIGDLGYVTSYDPPGDMLFNTTHYWKVVPYNGFGDNLNAVTWSFTTAGAPLAGDKTIGGPGADYATFTAAISALNGAGVGTGGVTFNVASGTYPENPPPIVVSGSASNPIIFQSARENVTNPILTPTGGTNTYGFKLDGADYITFDGIDIANAEGLTTLVYGYWIAALTNNGSTNVTITNCNITLAGTLTTTRGINSLGVTGGANTYLTITNNTIINSYNAIYLTGSSTAGSEMQNTLIQGNTITGVRNYGIYFGYGINTLIDENEISFPTAATTALYGIYTFGSTNTVMVSDNNIAGGSTSSTVYGLYSASGTTTFSNNSVSNVFNTSSSGWYGMYAGGGDTTWIGNAITGITNTGTAAVYSAYITTGNHTFNGNEISNIATGGTSLYGYYIIGGTTLNIYNNKVYNLRYTGVGTGIIYGIHVGSGTTVNVYNNMIYDLRLATTIGTAPQVRAISISSGTARNIWNNTVYLNSVSSGASFATAALYVSTNLNTIDLKNNIFVNNSVAGATGRTVAFWKTSLTVDNLTAESNKNIYYAGEPGLLNLIGYFNTTAYQTIEDYKLAAGTKDQGSYSENVPFVRTEEPYDLHIDPSTVTRVESNALPIAMVTNDIDGDARGLMPDIGADEGTFTAPQGAPGNVSLISPADQALNVNPNALILTWSPPTTGGTASSYAVFVSDDPDDVFVYTQNTTGTSFNLDDMTDLELGFGNTWYWAVQAFAGEEGSDVEDPSFMVRSFTTAKQMSASTTLNIGNVWPGSDTNGTLAVQNIGAAALTVEVNASDEFRFGALGRYTIPGFGTVNLPYTFTAPTTTGAYSGFVTLTETAPGSSVINVTATANISADLTVGNGTTNMYLPVYPYFGYTYSQTIYPASWLNYPDGYRIERLQYYWNPALAPLNTSHFQVWMGHTTQANFPSTGATWVPISQMTLVFDGTWDISAGAGWKELTLQSPFVYNRTDNLIIAMYEDTPGYDTSGNTTTAFFHGTSTPGTNYGVSYYSDTAPGSPIPPNPTAFTATVRAGYPNTRFIVAEIPEVPVITVNPDAWNFGSVIINTPATKVFTISNSGAGVLTVNSISVPDGTPYTLQNLPAFPLNLATAEAATFTVQYLPTSVGTHNSVVTISDNRAITEIALSGICRDPRISNLPHTENFDIDVVTPNLPLGWSSIVNSTSTSAALQTYTTGTPYSTPNHIYMANSADATANLTLISPQVMFNINTLRVKFRAKGSAGYTLIVGTADVSGPTATFTAHQTVTLTATYNQYSVDFSAYAGTNQYIAFKHGGGGTYRTIYMDDVIVEVPAPIPPEPVSLNFPINNLTTLNNPLLSWTPSSTGEPTTSYKVYLNGNLMDTVTTTTYQTTNLVAGNTYTWKIEPGNVNGFNTTAVTNTFHIVTNGYLGESFENVAFPPAGWANPGSFTRSTTLPFVGVGSAYKFTSTTASFMLTTPQLSIVNGSTLNFYARTASTNDQQRIQIKHSADNALWEDIGAPIALNNGVLWTPYSVDLSSLAPTPVNKYLGFSVYTSGTTTGSVYIDHVIGPMITPLPVQPVTLNLPADAATGVSETPTFTWTAATTGGVPTGYKVYCDQNLNPTTLVATVTLTSYTMVNALNFGETYYWKVIAFNPTYESEGNTVRSFTVRQDPTIYHASLPFFEGFEVGNTDQSANIANWASVRDSGYSPGNDWLANSLQTTYNRTPRTGSWNATLRYNSDTWLGRPMYLMGGTSYDIELYARQDNAVTTNATLGVYYGTTPTPAGMTNAIITHTGLTNGDYQRLFASFTPATTGLYYLGIKGWINITPWYISLDDITLKVTPGADLDVPEVIISAGATTGTVRLDWEAVTGADWYAIYSSTDPHAAFGPEDGTPEYVTTDNFKVVTVDTDTKVFFKVTAGSGTPPQVGLNASPSPLLRTRP